MLTTTTAANTIRTAYAPGFEEACFRNHTLFGMFTWTDADGDTSYRWKLNDTGNDSVQVFTEGQGQPDAGVQSFQNAAVAWTYFRFMVQVTGHARDALKSRYIDHIDEEARLGRSDLVDLITTSFMGSTYGLELAVDYGSSYAGITRNGSAGYFESTETAVSGPLSTNAGLTLIETIRDNDKGGKPSLVVAAINQQTNFYELAGPHVIYNGNPADKAPGYDGQTFAGLPCVFLPDFTDTVVMILDMRPNNWAPKQIRPFSVKEMAPSGDSDLYQVSWGGALVNRMPKFQGKLTGVAA